MEKHDPSPEDPPSGERPLPNAAESPRLSDAAEQPRKSANRNIAITRAVMLVISLGVAALVVVGVLLPAVARVRESAARAQTNSNLKQCALAIHTYHDNFKKLPNAFSRFGGNPEVKTFGAGDKRVSMWSMILPYIGEVEKYRNGDTDALIDAFQSPSSPIPAERGTIAFAGSLRIFANKSGTSCGSITCWMAMPEHGDVLSGLKLQNIADGAENTIMLTTKYNVCNGAKTYYAADVKGNINGNAPPSPGFGAFSGAGFPSTPPVRQNPPATTIFQLAPSPDECVSIAGLFGQSFSDGGMSIALADAAVRNISPKMKPETFYSALCPGDGIPLGADWNEDE